ncbi:glycosyl transferase 2 family protein [Pseudarthrobacter siccitolerans]|uniref:Glycosyl transferase 2 family protein n=1 Tax=Pseudarthrobacter siccitolerans TaxID=861266 RepID=A0A024H1C8_9MICC|nr:glycosyltransferase [Pseudarthrobacter siccitolerans]CCQ45569.1 glycosyl transferase 2 family protein [Pseudarthrobacter siccitolerans]
MRYDSSTFGVIALAAYQPDWELFKTQLRSIQNQTHSQFQCLISADGGLAEIRDFVDREFGGDERFRVLGFEERLGFYGNFERVLQHIPAEAAWVALSDQDDSWYPSKLEVLLPHLNDVSLVGGQARVVRLPANEVVTESTQRKNVDLAALLAQNQVTGGLCVFQRDLLDLALPFPRLNTVSQVHDHWLAVCAKATGGALVVDDVVQDYVQHGGNVLGEVGGRKSIFKSIEHVAALSRKFQGSSGPFAMLQTANDLSFGWRRVMADALRARVARDAPGLEHGLAGFETGHGWVPTSRVLLSGLRSGNIALPCFIEFVAGAPVEVFSRRGMRRGRSSGARSTHL